MVIALLVLAVFLVAVMIGAAIYGWRSAAPVSASVIELDSRVRDDNSDYPSIEVEIKPTNTYEWASSQIA